MTDHASVQQYVVLPPRGLRNAFPHASAEVTTFLSTLSTHTRATAAAEMPGAPGVALRVVDSIHEDGAKLVEMSDRAAHELRAHQPGLRIVPVVYYFPAIAPRPTPASKPAAAQAAIKTAIHVVSRKGGAPIAGATVVAFTDFANRVGAQETTNAQGIVRLPIPTGTHLERLYVYSVSGFWNGLKRRVTLTSDYTVSLIPIDLGYTDELRFFYGNADLNAGHGVRVGVVDTGIAQHPDLAIEGGFNAVVGEDPNDFGDNGEGHGTHVAGIIAGRGATPAGVRGVAPGAALRSYRVFGKGEGGASNYAISKAIDRAVADKCDLINMSLGGGPADEATRSAIRDARAAGTLALVANGNDDRSPVSFPASDPLSIAVAALGRKGTFPSGTVEWGDIEKPYGTDKKNFVAAFSNIGPETDLIAPGLGIISTFPGGYAVLDGTSMACPAATGRAAALLTQQPAILGMPRNEARSDAIARLVLQAAKDLGFAPNYEGQGMP